MIIGNDKFFRDSQINNKQQKLFFYFGSCTLKNESKSALSLKNVTKHYHEIM